MQSAILAPCEYGRQPAPRARPCFANQRLLVVLLLSLLSICTAVGSANDSQTGSLHWANGDQMLGQLLGSTSSRLRWKSSIFAEPFSLDLKQLLSVRFPQTEKPEQVEPLRFITHAGDVLYGELVDITDRQLVINSRRHGQVKLPQSAIRTFRRLHDEGLIYLGPNGVDGWKTVSVQRRTSEWTTNSEGELSTTILGAELFRDLKLPEISEIELTLRWDRRPGFLITFADPSALRLSQEAVRLETWEDELVLQTLAGNGDFEQLLILEPETKSIELRLLWNQRSGELFVYSVHGELLGKMSAGPETGKNHTGMYIKNKGSDLTLARLRVSNWSGRAPSSTVDERASCVRLIDGERVYGQLRAYDRQTNSLIVELPSARRQQVALDKIASVSFADVPDEPPVKSQMMLSYYDGTLLRGSLESIEAGTVTVKTGYCEQPITAHLRGARRLQFADEAVLLANSAVLEMGKIKLHGQLASAGSSGSMLGWKPVGSSNASPLPPDRTARVIREPAVGEERSPDHRPDVVYLNNGDILPCHVVSIDPTHLVIDSAFATAARVPLDLATAVEFGADTYFPLAGFAGKRWSVVEKEQGAVERTDKQVIFHGQASLGHRDVLRGDEISFDMQWSASTPVAMTISFFAKDPKRSTPPSIPPSILVYCVQQQLFVRGIRGGHQLIQARSRQEVFQNKRAKLKFKLAKKKLEVFVDQRQVLTQSLAERDRAGQGLVLAVQRLDGGRGKAAREELVTISDFRVGRSAGPFGSLQVEEDQKDVVLTVPRSRKKNPPTHVLVAQNGDLLRGRLLALTETTAHFTSRLDDFAFPRERLAGIIWLQQEKDKAPPLSGAGVVTQVVFASGATLTFRADKMVQNRIGGNHPILGPCSIPRSAIRELRIGYPEGGPQKTAYSDWKLRPAKEPQFAGSGNSPPGADAIPGLDSPLVGTVAADFEVPLLDGQSFKLSDHADKVVILDFWATWCGPCVRALPQIIETVGAFPPEKVLLVAINQQEKTQAIRDFLKARGWQVTVALDRDGKIGRKFQVEAIPQTVIVGRGGKIERLHVGAHADFQDQLENVLKQLASPEKPVGNQE